MRALCVMMGVFATLAVYETPNFWWAVGALVAVDMFNHWQKGGRE